MKIHIIAIGRNVPTSTVSQGDQTDGEKKTNFSWPKLTGLASLTTQHISEKELVTKRITMEGYLFYSPDSSKQSARDQQQHKSIT